MVRSIDVLSLKEYNYSYEDGRITRSTECNITLNESGLVIKKNLVNSIIYYYDQEGSLTRKRIIPASGSEQVIYYENPENENTVVKFTAGGKTVTSHSKNDGHTLSWENGRQSKQLTKSDGTTVSYTYDANGIRTSKTVNGTTHTYTLDGTKILKEVWGSNTLIPLYDNEDSVCGVILNDEPYYFYKNQQGDIIEIADKDSKTIARHTYDAWGKVLSVTDAEGGEITDQATIAHINPYRYRGYYYDVDTELYYLQSRYYNPVVGRFVSSDVPEMLGLSIYIDYASNR